MFSGCMCNNKDVVKDVAVEAETVEAADKQTPLVEAETVEAADKQTPPVEAADEQGPPEAVVVETVEAADDRRPPEAAEGEEPTNTDACAPENQEQRGGEGAAAEAVDEPAPEAAKEKDGVAEDPKQAVGDGAAEETKQAAEGALSKVDEDRKKAVDAFLRSNGFKKGVNVAKKSMLKTTYPLHLAAAKGDDEMVKMLLQEGAKIDQTASKKTAYQLAEANDKKGSHAKVLATLKEAGGAGLQTK